MASHATVGVDDDLATSESGVAHRAADLEATGRVDQQAEVSRLDVEVGELGAYHELLDIGSQQRRKVDVGGVLRRHNDRVEAHGLVVVVVLDGDLSLAIRTQVGDRPVLANLGQTTREVVREVNRERHQLGGVVARVAEHQALVAGALLVEVVDSLAGAVLERVVDALGDVGALRADRHADATRRAVETLLARVIADLEDRVAHDAGDVDPPGGGHLARDVHLTGRDEGLDGDAALGVLFEHRVQDRVADLVGDLVRVSFGDGLGREQATGHGRAPHDRD